MPNNPEEHPGEYGHHVGSDGTTTFFADGDKAEQLVKLAHSHEGQQGAGCTKLTVGEEFAILSVPSIQDAEISDALME